MVNIPRLPAVEAVAVGADPHGATGCLRDGGNHVIGKIRHRAEVLLSQNIEAAGLGSNPKITFSILGD